MFFSEPTLKEIVGSPDSKGDCSETEIDEAWTLDACDDASESSSPVDSPFKSIKF